MFRILDLFCGAGGFSAGFEKNSFFKSLIGVDFDDQAIKTFKHNFKDATAICGDLKDEKVKNKIINLSKKLKINMIIGGPPCQGFSLKGKNLGLKDERNFLFLEYLNIVKILKPKIFIIENVKNLYSSANGYFKNEIIKIIENLGYFVNTKILNAKDYLVPQNRERIFFIAYKDKMLDFPQPFEKIITVKDAIGDLAYLESGKGEIQSKYELKANSNYQKEKRKNSKILQFHKATNHSLVALKKLKLIPPESGKEFLPKNLHGKQKFSTTWSRLAWDEISPTIDTRFDTPSNGKNSHPFLHRAITPREAARIQGFDDDFWFLGTKTSVCKQIGNAVPPPLALSLANSIISQIKQDEIMHKNYQIYNSNAFTLVEKFIKDDLKVNHIITDPPYNISQENNFSTMKSANRQGINFGSWDRNFDLFGWIEKYSQILDKNGSMIIFCSYKFISYICDALQNTNLEVKDILVWQKNNPMPRNVTRRYVQDMEFAIWAVNKGSKWVFNKPSNLPYLRGFFQAPVVSGKERLNHPTQKSLKLMSEIIKIHTNKNEIILDPFMGSGTTGVAALNLGRKFIGIEISLKFYNIAKSRIY